MSVVNPTSIYVLIELSDGLINKARGFYGATEEDAEEE